MSAGCGCCACLAGAGGHVDVVNRPGLSAISYRVGQHRTFLEAMLRRLTLSPDPAGSPYSLHGLTTRQPDDPVLAILDAWAVVGDVLTFYQERIANEGYLRTAVERRSVLELGTLVGYRLKPGVSASAYLAYTIDDNARTTIAAGSKAQSVPGPGELPQTFETSEALEARAAWNAMRPRLSRPLSITIDNVQTIGSLSIEGTTTRLEPRDPLLFVFEVTGTGETVNLPTTLYAMRRVLRVVPDLERTRTEVFLEPVRPYYRQLAAAMRRMITEARTIRTRTRSARAVAPLLTHVQFFQNVLLGVGRVQLQQLARKSFIDIPEVKAEDADEAAIQQDVTPPDLADLLPALLRARGRAPRSQWQFDRSLRDALRRGSDYVPRLLASIYPQLQDTIYTAIANNGSGRVPFAQFRSVHVLRRRAGVFGYNAPTVLFEERPEAGQPSGVPVPQFVPENASTLNLDTPAEAVAVGSLVLTLSDIGATVNRVLEADTAPRTAYGVSGKSTRLVLSGRWTRALADQAGSGNAIDVMVGNLKSVRMTSVAAESEELVLAQQLLDRPVGKLAKRRPDDPESESRIELDAVVEGLEPGRWVIVTGERLDTTGTRGVAGAELAMVAAVEHEGDAGPGGAPYSVLVLAPEGLAYQYRRETVRILGNVVKATHGEERGEILGGGDASQPLQSFSLHHAPLTFTAAPVVAGVASTLAVRVNDVLWHEVDSLNGTAAGAPVYTTRTSDDGQVTVTFGNGVNGARVPTGVDNVRAVYRSGIGTGGNVRAGQIATAISRPYALRDVINPLPARGGADPESRDDARRSIPVSLQAMGRVVSVEDYADFARTFAGIAKAVAVRLSDGRRRLVHLTVGGADDIEIDPTSDLYRNLVDALRRFGDPYQPFVVQPREQVVIVGSATVRVHPDYLWTNVAPAIRAALLDTFGYRRREFGQVLFPAEVVAAVQRVPGVLYVDLNELRGLSPTDVVGLATRPTSPAKKMASPRQPMPIVPRRAEVSRPDLLPAQIVYLPPALADLFVLTEVAHG